MSKLPNRSDLSHPSQGGQFMLAYTFTDVKIALRTECEQRVIVRFLLNEGSNARQSEERLTVQSHEDACPFRTVQCWITEVR
jgi:hypothetical protein